MASAIIVKVAPRSLAQEREYELPILMSTSVWSVSPLGSPAQVATFLDRTCFRPAIRQEDAWALQYRTLNTPRQQ